MFGISMSSISMIVGLISLGIVCLVAFFNYTRNFDVSKRIRRIEKGMEDINNEIFKIHKWIKDSELENQLSTTALHNKIKTEISIDEPINIDSEGNDLSLADILGTDNDAIFKSVEDDENKKILKKCIENLEDREKIIMKLRYGFDGKDELTQKEVADKLGISQSYISRLEKKVINDLKRDFSA